MGYQVTNEIVRSAHEIAVCVKIHIRYDILICRKFLCVAIFGPGGAGLTSFYCNFTSYLVDKKFVEWMSCFFLFLLPFSTSFFLVPPPPTPLSLLVIVPAHFVQFPYPLSSTP